MTPLGTGLIGCGRIAEVHAEALATLPESRFRPSVTWMGRVHRTLPPRNVPHAYGTWLTCCARLAWRRCSSARRIPYTRPSSFAAAEAGIHVICEKPMTVDLAAADAMIAATRRAGVTFGVIFQRRFWPAAQRLRAAIDAGKLGRVILGDCLLKWWRSAGVLHARSLARQVGDRGRRRAG